MTSKVVKDFAAVLVHNFYESNPSITAHSASLVCDILMQIREAGEMNSVEITYDSEKVVFTNNDQAMQQSLTLKHSELPDKSDMNQMKKFIEKILDEVFY